MKTCCPNCQTIFRVTSQQLRVRAGKVRCGNCHTIFDAIAALLDDSAPSTPNLPIAQTPQQPAPPLTLLPPAHVVAAGQTEPPATALASAHARSPALPPEAPAEGTHATAATDPDGADQPAAADAPRATRAMSAASDPGRWLEGVESQPAATADRGATRPFAIATALLAVALAGQLVFHFRSAIAITLPVLRPALAAFSTAVGCDMPLPRYAELLSIEASDLQTDPEHDKLLALQATLRNRAPYAQAYPALELTLTDSTDKAVARRVFLPDQYLPPTALDDAVFAANVDVEIRLWLEATNLPAAGYRLYVFYP